MVRNYMGGLHRDPWILCHIHGLGHDRWVYRKPCLLLHHLLYDGMDQN